MKKKKQSNEIPITITTGEYDFQSNDVHENLYNRLEFAQLNILSIFNLIGRSATDAEGESGEELDQFLNDLRNIADIGKGLLTEIQQTVSDLSDLRETDAPNENEPDKTGRIAEQISALLHTKNLPDELYNSIIEGLDRIADVSNSKTLSRIETSAEYIESLLTDYREAREDKSDE